MEELKNQRVNEEISNIVGSTENNVVEYTNNTNDNSVDLEELEFDPIKRVIDFKDKNGNMKHITIFNLTDEQITKLQETSAKYMVIEDGQIKSLNVPQSIFLKEYLQELTDIKLPSDNEKLEKILNHPNDVLKEVLLEVTEISKKAMSQFIKALQLNKEVLQEQANLTDDKLIKMAELQNKQKELTILSEKEKQITLQEKAKTNEDEVKKLQQEVFKLKTENFDKSVELEKSKEIKPKRKYNKKKKDIEIVENKSKVESEIDTGEKNE